MVLNDNLRKESPVFILSAPRSGSTLLRLILNHNSYISIPNEYPLVENVIVSFAHKDVISKHEAQCFIKGLSNNKHFQEWNIHLEDLLSKVKEKNVYSRSSLIQLIYSEYSKKRIKVELWGDKNIHSLAYISEILELFPKAKFIHIIRDGRDVSLSLKKVGWLFYKFPRRKRHYLNDVKGCAATWVDALDLINEKRHLVHDDNFHEVKYEQLITDSMLQITAICQFLGVPFENNMLDFYRGQNISTSRLRSTHKNTGRPILKDNQKKFLVNLSKREIKTIESIAGDWLSTYKYETTTRREDEKDWILLIKSFTYIIESRIIYVFFWVRQRLKLK